VFYLNTPCTSISFIEHLVGTISNFSGENMGGLVRFLEALRWSLDEDDGGDKDEFEMAVVALTVSPLPATEHQEQDGSSGKKRGIDCATATARRQELCEIVSSIETKKKAGSSTGVHQRGG
jgi:hypothetical protein